MLSINSGEFYNNTESEHMYTIAFNLNSQGKKQIKKERADLFDLPNPLNSGLAGLGLLIPAFRRPMLDNVLCKRFRCQFIQIILKLLD